MAVFTSRDLLYVLLVRQLITVSTCSSGFFLSDNRNCIACPEHCLECDSEDYCLYCEKGYWGNVCELSCSNCMTGTSCGKTNGFCKEECEYGYSGLLCNVKCDNKCISCNRENPQNCSKCAPGRYPVQDCGKICSGCHEQNCDETGICALRCVDGFWGQSCEKMCSQNCMYVSCDRDNGTCSASCNDNSAGLQCNETNTNPMPVIPIVVAAAAGAIVLVVIACSVLCLRRRRKKSPSDSQPEAAELIEVITDADTENDRAPRSTDTAGAVPQGAAIGSSVGATLVSVGAIEGSGRAVADAADLSVENVMPQLCSPKTSADRVIQSAVTGKSVGAALGSSAGATAGVVAGAAMGLVDSVTLRILNLV